MKTAILPCLQEYSVTTPTTFIMTKWQKKLKLQCFCKIVQNVCFSLQITRFMKTAILECLQQFFQ